MTIFDYVFLLILVVSMFISVIRGLVREVLSLVSWIAAFIIAKYLSPLVASWSSDLIAHPQIRIGFSFVLVMVACVMLFSLLSLQIVKVVRMTGLTSTDRALGAFFGLARGVLVAVVLVLVLGLTPLPEQRYWRTAFFRYPLETMASWMQPRLPNEVQKRMNP